MSAAVAVAVEPERTEEMVLVAGRRIEMGELFWPEESAIHLLADSWEMVDPMEDDNNAVSHLMINPETGDMAHQAKKPLIQLDLAPQPGGSLIVGEFYRGTVDLFAADLPTIAGIVKASGTTREKRGAFLMLLVYEVGYIEEGRILEKRLKGHLLASSMPFVHIRNTQIHQVTLPPD